MEDILGRMEYEAVRPKKVSTGSDVGANISLQDGEINEVHSGRLGAAGGRMERRNSVPPGAHQRHMPLGLLKFPIPRKNKEKRALFQDVSMESREYEDMLTVLTSSYMDTNSASCFTYSTPRLVNSELLEKEFVEKRREMKSDGRSDKELEESYCFLLPDGVLVHSVCEKGLSVGQSWITILGNPGKGVYLSRYSDLLQVNPITPGTTGEIIIFKVMKGKVKSIYENMKNLLDPTPRFDSHIAKNASKVTSLASYRAHELTQQYFYEYSFDELRQRPRQVCPYAVVCFRFKGKDSAHPSTPLAPIRMNSQSAEGSKEPAQFTVWSGDLVKGDSVLFQISLRSFSPPFLPHKLPEKLEIGSLIRFDQLDKLLPPELFNYNLYKNSQEVLKNGHCCTLLEVADKSRCATSVVGLLNELEINRVVLVTPLTERGFLFLLSSVQMATPSEREENWKRCLQALFVFPDSRDVAKFTLKVSSSHDTSESSTSSGTVMPQLNQFIPALHHALVKAYANPPPELSAGVERQARDYFIGLKDGKVRRYPMGKYESKLDELEKGFPAPKHHKANMDGFLRSYLYNPAIYLLSVARARLILDLHSDPEEPQELMDLTKTCTKNAENEGKKEQGCRGRGAAPGRKRQLESETTERAVKFLKASREPGNHSKIPVEGSQVSPSRGSLASVIGSVELKDTDLREEGSGLAANFFSMLTGLSQAALATTNQSLGKVQEEGQRESCPFDSLAAKLGLPTNCDIDLRKQEELEEQAAGSASSLEGFSPSSHSGEMNHHGAAGRGLGKRGAGGGYEEEEENGLIPWVLIPISGLCSERYGQRERNTPQDPRFHRVAMTTSITTAAKPPRNSPSLSPEPSPPPSLSQCPSPDPSPPPSLSQCPSPEPNSPPSPSQCPSPEPPTPPSPSQCPSPQPSPPRYPYQCPSLQVRHSPSRYQSQNEQSLFNMEHSGANKKQPAPTASWESAGVKDIKNEALPIPVSMGPSSMAALERRTPLLPPTTGLRSPEVKTETVMEPVKEERETSKRVQNREKEERSEGKQQDVVRVSVGGGDKEQKGEATELLGGSLLSPPPSSPLFRHIDGIMDKHLGNFSSDIQLVLQKENICYTLPNPSSNATAPQNLHPLGPISQFSQYVSFYTPCPPVKDYVSSLQDNIHSMMTELDPGWPSHTPKATNTDVTLANRVSAFVSSIRAANSSADDDGEETVHTSAPVPQDAWPSPSSRVTSSATTSACGSAYNPISTAVLPAPNMSPQPPWQPHSHTPETNSTGLAGAGCEATLPGFSDLPKKLPEPSHPSKPGSSPSPFSLLGHSTGPPTPTPTTALSSLISQLQPEVFSNLVEIIKDVKRNSVQFYLHSTEAPDPVYEHIKEHLLKQGNVEQNPVAFLNQETSDSRLLVVIKNQDIAGHVHEIPGLVSLKRHPNVMFVGIDTLDDIRNNSYNELFSSGGCIVSDEMVLNPDVITHDQLTALLMLLEKHSSPASVWRWKVHCKTHKKLKEQSRFRRDAADLLDVLSAYQKRQIVEFLPYHYCDTMSHQSPYLDCVIELQARYTQYRHTVLLTDRHSDFPVYSNGIIVASIDEILHDFTRLVGYHSNKGNQPIIDDMLAPKEQLHSLSALKPPQHLLLQPGSSLSSLCHLSDQLVPDGSCKDGVLQPSGKDYEDLRLAISHLRAERQAQKQQVKLSVSPFNSLFPSPHHTPPPLGEGRRNESAHVPPDKKEVAASLDLIHSALQMELCEEEEERTKGGADGQRSGGSGAGGAKVAEQRDCTPVRVAGSLGGNLGPSNSNTSTPAANQNTTTNDGRDKVPKHGAASSSSTACPVLAINRSRDTKVSRQQPVRGEGAPAGSNAMRSTTTDQQHTPNPAPPCRRHTQHLQPLNEPQQHVYQNPSLPQQPPHSQQQQGINLLRQPRLLHVPNQPFTQPFMMPLTTLRGGLLGSRPVWPGGLGPAGAAALVWSFPQANRDFTESSLLAGYRNPACHGNRYRGEQRGGGFTGM